jgi:Carboxypeptidase regulatory-like domain/TonB-dependent Receptor Plug Domain
LRTSRSASWRPLLLLAIMIALTSGEAPAQLDSATLAGHVVDSSGVGIGGARVTLIDVDRNTRASRSTEKNGFYVFPDVKPGRYRVEISASGFRMADLANLILNTADTLQHNFTLAAGPEPGALGGNGLAARTSGAVSTVIDQELVEELPLNGRSFQTLFQLTPGVVITPTSFASQGQFSVNGQRTDANYFLVDGVSANFGISVGGSLGQSAGGSLPALTALGGTNSLVSTDDVQEFAVLTSSFAPEFGRTPGGQISIVTRSGTNRIREEMFDYIRNDAVDANDWFANQHNLRRAALRQNDFGGVVGGPIRENQTFFFFSYEGLQLRQPTTGQSDVPSLTARESASPSIAPFFNAYPLPNGPDEGNGLAPATYAFSNPSTLDAASVRLDDHLTEALTMFARYSVSASDQRLRGATGTSLNSVTDLHFTLQTLTLGSTWSPTSHFSNDARLNWSTSTAAFSVDLDSFGGAIPVSLKSMIPSLFANNNFLFQFVPAPSAQHPDLEFGRNVANLQSQINFIDSLTLQLSAHSIKGGIDLRRLNPQIRPAAYLQEALFNDVSAAVTGAASVDVVQTRTSVQSTFVNLSLFVQDSWRPRRWTLTYGLRWDFNPTPSGRGSNGLRPFVVMGFNNLPTLSLAPAGSPLYRSTANNFAPRVGVAYELRKSTNTELLIRAGAGVFYDYGNGPVGNAFSAQVAPFLATKTLIGVPFPLSPPDAAPPSISINPPFNQMIAFPSVLKLPYTNQWNVSLEQSIGSSVALSVGYIGSAGHSLLRTEQYVGGEAGVPLLFGQLLFTSNGGYSNYNSLQAQLRRRASRQLDIVASYSYSHSLDDISTDEASTLPGRSIQRRTDYGPSDFDIRHVAAIALDYTLPTSNLSSTSKMLFSGWVVDPIVTLRSAPPVDVVLSRITDLGISFRPDRTPGMPLYLNNPGVPGGVRINPAAFSAPANVPQGDLGRNNLRGFSLLEGDLALRRDFYLTNKLGISVRVEAFNLFNHPNFAPESGQLGVVDTTGKLVLQSGFGISGNTLGNGLQTGGPGSGFSPSYQIGQARSLQVAMKLRF